MKRQRSLPLVFVLVFLTASSITAFQPVKAQFLGSITINTDGSVSPSTAPIEQVGNIYTLTTDMEGSITVKRNNTILEGNGHTITAGGGAGGQYTAISVDHVSNVTVKNFSITCLQGVYYNQLDFGINLEFASNVTVTNNTITKTQSIQVLNGEPTAGIYGSNGGLNVITENNLADNQVGIFFSQTENNLITGNNITGGSNSMGNYSVGIIVESASNNDIYHNNFVNNIGGQVREFGSINVWDNGYPSGGNYWSDYSVRYYNGTEIDKSGIGDTPYVIDSQNKDRYPLVNPFNETFYVQKTTPPKISVLSPLNQTYNNSTVPLVFNVDKQVNWTGYSLDNEQNATLTDNSTIANITSGLHSIIVYANDTFGNVGASETTSFTVAKPEPSPSPSPSPSPTPSPSQQPTQSSEPSATSISPMELIFVTATVVIASIAAIAINKRHKRKV